MSDTQRTTQLGAEVVSRDFLKSRITQVGVEVSSTLASGPLPVRVSQVGAEVPSPHYRAVRISQVGVEVATLYAPTPPVTRRRLTPLVQM